MVEINRGASRFFKFVIFELTSSLSAGSISNIRPGQGPIIPSNPTSLLQSPSAIVADKPAVQSASELPPFTDVAASGRVTIPSRVDSTDATANLTPAPTYTSSATNGK